MGLSWPGTAWAKWLIIEQLYDHQGNLAAVIGCRC